MKKYEEAFESVSNCKDKKMLALDELPAACGEKLQAIGNNMSLYTRLLQELNKLVSILLALLQYARIAYVQRSSV